MDYLEICQYLLPGAGNVIHVAFHRPVLRVYTESVNLRQFLTDIGHCEYSNESAIFFENLIFLLNCV